MGAGAGLVTAGFVTQRIVDRAVDRLPSRGQDIDVDGRSVHVQVWGPDDPETPTVIAGSGVGGTSADWAGVAALLDGTVRLVAVDRPGLGRSAPGPVSDVDRTIRRIEVVKDVLGIDGAVVLAGWSMGGLLAVGVALARADLVSGLVLVEPSHPDEARRFNDAALHPAGRWMWRAVGLGSRLGGAAVAGIPSRLTYLRFSSDSAHEPRWQVPTFARGDVGVAFAAEMLAFPQLCDDVGRLHAERGAGASAVPCVLLSASRRRGAAESEAWAEMHGDLATWIPGTDLVVVQRSGHNMLGDRPDAVAEAIGEVVGRAWT